MGKEIALFKNEDRKDLASVVALVHQLLDKLASKQVVLQQGSAKSLWTSLIISPSS